MQPHPFDVGWSAGWMPRPRITVWEWADKYRILPSKGAAEHGQWKTSRTPYLQEPMECLSEHNPTQLVALMFGAQTGKTESGLNWIGCTADEYPSPFLMLQPTIMMAERVSKQRIDPMIEATPRLREVFSAAKSRDSDNTLLMKGFRGGVLILSGANSAASLASMPIGKLFADEIDRMPRDVEDEGDPLALAIERTNTFGPRKKILVTSTPTIKGESRIESVYLDTDQCRYFCPCPHCGALDYWRWENIRWEPGHPETAMLLCRTCGVLIEERFKTWMMARENGAEWRPTAVSKNPLHRGFHLPGLYSPFGWKSWRELADQFTRGQKNPTILKTFVNVGLAETWEEVGDSHDAKDLIARVEDYEGVPADVAVLTMTVDVQRNWLEATVYGWGPGDESWLIDHQRFDGRTATDPEPWERLDAMRLSTYTRADGLKMRPAICTIDIGDGDNQEPVFRFVQLRQAQGVFASKGVKFHARPVLVQQGQKKDGKIRLFTYATHPMKQLVFERLKIEPGKPGERNPGCIHFPSWTTEEFFAQLTGEKLVGREVRRTKRIVKEWVKVHSNNEALDMTVYALGALRVLQTILAPNLYKDLDQTLAVSRGEIRPQMRGRRVRSEGI